MQITYCIICHRNTQILRTTIDLLSDDNEIYIHVDKKANMNDFEEYNSKVHFVNNRIEVQWGRYSLIECTLVLLRAIKDANFDYVCLLSGDDLPLMNSDRIKKVFDEHAGMEFIGIQKNFNALELENRVKYEHSEFSSKRDKTIIEKVFFETIYKLFPMKLNQQYEMLPQLYKGAEWFCISKSLKHYILDYLEQNEWYTEAFKNSHCGDEVFFQTIVMNSHYREKVFRINSGFDDNAMALRYIDWHTGPEYPKILTEKDLRNISDDKLIFGRKFHEKTDIGKYKQWLKDRFI